MAKSRIKTEAAQWDELKEILNYEEWARLNSLETRLFHPTEFANAMGDVLPQAIDRSDELGERLSSSLYPVVEKSIYKSVQRDPESLAGAIFPVMAPAIRKAISDSMKKLNESINQSVESSLSIKGIKWRLEALVSGKKYSEVLMSHALVYRIEEVFLIHKETGLLLAHACQDEERAQDGDMVSAMLTAIRDFIQDSFKVNKNDSLQTIEVGEHAVWIEQGPHASLACVVNGEAPIEYREHMGLVIENAHKDYGLEIMNFKGETSAFDPLIPMLETCLVTKLDGDNKKKSGKTKVIVSLIIVILLGLIGLRIFWNVHWDKLVDRFNEEPGIIIINEGRKGHNFTASLLRDPIAMNPNDLIQGSKIKLSRIKVNSSFYSSTNEQLAINRIKEIINSDPNVEAHQIDSLLIISGETNYDRLTQLKYWLPFLTGDIKLDFNQLSSFEENRLFEIAKDLNKTLIYFDTGQMVPSSGQENSFAFLSSALNEADALLSKLNKVSILVVTGACDPRGTIEINSRLEDMRANYIIKHFIQEEFENIIIQTGIPGDSNIARLGSNISTMDQMRNVSFVLNILN